MSAAGSILAADQIEGWLVRRISEMTSEREEQIQRDEVFDGLGLDSALIVELVGDLEDWLGLELSPTLAYEFPTIATISEHLSNEVSNGGRTS